MSQSPAPVSSPPSSPASSERESLVSVISWKAVLAGSLTTLALSLTAGNLTAAYFAGNLGAQASILFASMFIGAFVAGRVSGRFGAIQGIAMAVIFILIGASLKAYNEIDLATTYGPQVLGPMDMGGLILGDLIYLLGGWMGGWFADSRASRTDQKR